MPRAICLARASADDDDIEEDGTSSNSSSASGSSDTESSSVEEQVDIGTKVGDERCEDQDLHPGPEDSCRPYHFGSSSSSADVSPGV